ncbi:MAG: glycine cleavage system protein [Bacillales bacterium]|jgi:glycine cleavage system H protein|nr:glycine cleavage system protein [Bacillales bacterium]
MSIPSNLLYSKDHEWVRTEDNKIVVGITAFAQDELGDIVFVELPEVGQSITANESFGSVESVKTVSDLIAPISGTVLEINEELSDQPELVNESPYEKAWMIVIEPSDLSELESLLNAEQYEQHIQ